VAYNFQAGNNKIKLLMEYEDVTQKVSFGTAVLAALMSGRKYDVIHQNGDCSRESNVHALVFRNKVLYQNAMSLQNSVWKRSTFKRLVVFCTEKEREDRALRKKMLIESRKRFLEAHKNQLDEFLCS
jgi:hypothetical protein